MFAMRCFRCGLAALVSSHWTSPLLFFVNYKKRPWWLVWRTVIMLRAKRKKGIQHWRRNSYRIRCCISQVICLVYRVGFNRVYKPFFNNIYRFVIKTSCFVHFNCVISTIHFLIMRLTWRVNLCTCIKTQIFTLPSCHVHLNALWLVSSYVRHQ